jgi:outer membrane immunogenic protein
MKISIAGSALALCLTSTLGLAADLSRPPPAPVYEPESFKLPWHGPYVGASLGYGWGTSTQTYDRAGNHGDATTDPTGGAASLTLGYNYLISPSFMVGVEGDLGLMDISADDKIVYDGHVYKTTFGSTWGTVRARAGVIFDRFLLYGTGGWAIMETDEVSIGNTPGETATNRSTRSGWVAGVGAEMAVSQNVTTKLEWLHMDFGTFNGYSANREDYSFKNEIDLIRVGLNYRF